MKISLLAVAAACASLAPASPALAQTRANAPTFEASFGYQPLFVGGSPGASFPFGLAVDLAGNAGAFSFIGEGGWSRRSEGNEPDAVEFDFWHVGAGARWTSRKHARIWPYAQALMGPAFHRVSGQVAGSDQTDATIHFMIQIGGGVNLVVRRGLGFVGAVDYRRASLDDVTEGGSGLNEMRLFAGVRLSR